MSLFSRVFRKSRPKPQSFVVRWSRRRMAECEAKNEVTPEAVAISFLNHLCVFATPCSEETAEWEACLTSDSALFEVGCFMLVYICDWLNAEHAAFAEPVGKCFDDELFRAFTQALKLDNLGKLVDQRTSMYRQFSQSQDNYKRVEHHLSQLLFRTCDNREPEPYDPSRTDILLLDANDYLAVVTHFQAWMDGLVSMLERFDSDSGLWDSLGRSVAKKRKRADADCRQAIKLNPGNQNAWHMLGLSCDSQGRHDEAVAAFRQAIKLKPDDPDAWYALGWAYRKQGKRAEALDALDHLRKLDPSQAGKLADFLSSV